ncbi:MAG: DUF3427 domain-containing protein [Planctomycetes bacterium]|nr:DUF3427 domain-containing protein [Planctomycetota bacterium]
MGDLNRGLYDTLLTEALAARLAGLGPRLAPQLEPLRAAEAADRIALHFGRILQRAIDALHDKKSVVEGVRLARELVEMLETRFGDEAAAADTPAPAGEVLRAVRGRQPDGSPEVIEAPLIPLLDTTLLTNAPGEPGVGRQLLAEVGSADRIDVVMAFIRWSGIAPFLSDLRRHREAARPLRVLTTVYTGSTEARALEALRALGAEVRVSYDTSTTRLHAKAWLFHRRSGFSTAYIGSSNLSHSAQVSGIEWNVRVSGARNPDVLTKVAAVFESYWNSRDFEAYERETFEARVSRAAGTGSTILLSPLEVKLEPYQEHLLERIAVARAKGRHRNLLAAATGTGKTVMAAVDYARLRAELPRARLLFVAHREGILTQSLATFRQCLRDQAFGELWVHGVHPRRFEHVFASIQSLRTADLADLPPEHFDVVIVDEFHHAAASSYRALLEWVKPQELLGLTATPERSDGLPVLLWFDGRIAAELRLWDAIDQQRLAPFLYFGIHDGTDLSQVPWRRGVGYEVEHLHVAYAGHAEFPLQVHARYSRVEILAALGVGDGAKPPDWREGVRWVEEARADLLAFTLDRTSGQFSPTTRYRDYAISRDLIHWESQSTTREDSTTGRRYQTHQAQGSSILLFARLRADERAFWFLGPAAYAGHESEAPMAIRWKLEHPLPGDLYASFAAAVA